MALIKCPECGKDVSDTIESCIHCGFVLEKKEKVSDDISLTQENTTETSDSSHESDKEILNENSQIDEEEEKNNKIFYVVFAIVAVLLLCFASIKMFDSPQARIPVTDIDLITVRTELLSNEFATQEKYENQRYKVTNIALIDEIRENYIVALIPNNYGTLYVQLRYNSSELNFVRQLKKYDYVSFEGTLTELRTGGLWMYFENVVFIDKLDKSESLN